LHWQAPMIAGWPFATPLEQPDPSMSALVRTIQARTGNTLAAATRVSRAIQANQVVDLADVLPPTRDPLAPSQPAHFATLTAEGSWSFAQPVAQSALVGLADDDCAARRWARCGDGDWAGWVWRATVAMGLVVNVRASSWAVLSECKWGRPHTPMISASTPFVVDVALAGSRAFCVASAAEFTDSQVVQRCKAQTAHRLVAGQVGDYGRVGCGHGGRPARQFRERRHGQD